MVSGFRMFLVRCATEPFRRAQFAVKIKLPACAARVTYRLISRCKQVMGQRIARFQTRRMFQVWNGLARTALLQQQSSEPDLSFEEIRAIMNRFKEIVAGRILLAALARNFSQLKFSGSIFR